MSDCQLYFVRWAIIIIVYKCTERGQKCIRSKRTSYRAIRSIRYSRLFHSSQTTPAVFYAEELLPLAVLRAQLLQPSWWRRPTSRLAAAELKQIHCQATRLLCGWVSDAQNSGIASEKVSWCSVPSRPLEVPVMNWPREVLQLQHLTRLYSSGVRALQVASYAYPIIISYRIRYHRQLCCRILCLFAREQDIS